MTSGPSTETLSIVADDLGITMTDVRLAAAAASHAAFRPKLEELRRLGLDFLNPVEPTHAYQWIVSGGAQQLPKRESDAP